MRLGGAWCRTALRSSRRDRLVTGIAVEIARRLAPRGLDLAGTFRVQSYNPQVPRKYRLPTFGRDSTLAVVIGSSKAMWEPFLAWLAHEPRALDSFHPVDRYVAGAVRSALVPVEVRHQVRWAHSRLTRWVAIQKAAYTAGLAYHAPCHLAIHPRFGLWIGLRAAIAFDLPFAESAGPPAAGAAMAEPHPCDGCDRPCVAAFERAREATGGRRARDVSPWLAVREVCPRAPEHRYDDLETRYHYAKDRAVLREALRHAALASASLTSPR